MHLIRGARFWCVTNLSPLNSSHAHPQDLLGNLCRIDVHFMLKWLFLASAGMHSLNLRVARSLWCHFLYPMEVCKTFVMSIRWCPLSANDRGSDGGLTFPSWQRSLFPLPWTPLSVVAQSHHLSISSVSCRPSLWLRYLGTTSFLLLNCPSPSN